MADAAPRGCLAAKFDSCNSLLSSVHTLLVNIPRCVRLYTKRKYYILYIMILCSICCCTFSITQGGCSKVKPYDHVFIKKQSWKWCKILLFDDEEETTWFESHSSHHVETLSKSFTTSCLYDVMWLPAFRLTSTPVTAIYHPFILYLKTFRSVSDCLLNENSVIKERLL